jgi:hypothetical protein
MASTASGPESEKPDAETTAAESASLSSAEDADTSGGEPVTAETPSPDSSSAPAATAAASSTTSAEPTPPAVVYVTAPTPPRPRGARGVGVLVALLATGIFAAVYGLLVGMLAAVTPGTGIAAALRFTATPTFWIPVIVFGLAYTLLVVLVNRAGWWAHVLGGFLVAIVVWVAFVGAAIISAGAFGAPIGVVGAVVAEQLRNPIGFAAAIAAREVPVWVGWIVARRGRTARARNEAARAAYHKELAEHQSTVSGRTAV